MDDQHVRQSRRRRQPVDGQRSPVSVRMILGVVLVAVVAVAGLVYLGEALREPAPGVTGGLPAPIPANVETQVPAGEARTQPATADRPAPGALVYDGRSKGPKDAPVELIEYADFQCPFCAQHARLVGQQIDEAYVARGLVRVTYRYLAFIGPESEWAAVASECANEQGKFWPYHDKLYANQSGENQGGFAKDKLKGYARDLGLEGASFDACLESSKHTSLLRDLATEAQRLGVRSTPTFFLGEQKIEGAQPFSVFQRTFDDALAKRR